jgi:GntR family transcriptional regulator, vanillate catabolism transcriptional regulator
MLLVFESRIQTVPSGAGGPQTSGAQSRDQARTLLIGSSTICRCLGDHPTGSRLLAESETMDGIEPLRPRTRLLDDVVHRLRQDIVSGNLPAGTQLLQVDLANSLGISRTPLREALRILEADGLLKTSNNNRTVEVVTINSARLREMYEVREVIDGLAARLSAQRRFTSEAEERAQYLLAEMAAASKPYDPRRRTEAHAEYHALFVRTSGNEILEGLLPLIRLSSAALYFPFLNDPDAVALVNAGKIVTHREVLESTQHSHTEILESVLSGQPAKAEAAARRHIRGTLSVVDQLDEWRRIITEASLAEEREAQRPGSRM